MHLRICDASAGSPTDIAPPQDLDHDTVTRYVYRMTPKRRRGSATIPAATRLETEQHEALLALALRHDVDPAEILRRFAVAGLSANPVSLEERRAATARLARRASGDLPGLVIPMTPVAQAEPETAETKRGGRDYHPQAQPALISVNGRKAA